MDLDELQKVETYECQGCEKQRIRVLALAEAQAERSREKEMKIEQVRAAAKAKFTAKKPRKHVPTKAAKRQIFAEKDIECPIDGVRFVGYNCHP